MLVYGDNFFRGGEQGLFPMEGAVSEVSTFTQSLTQRGSDSQLQLLHLVRSEKAGM